jgi:F420-0:gamma-glutamyl ligase-like protein
MFAKNDGNIFVIQGCSVAVNPGAKKQREQLAGFPLSCVPQHYSCQMPENAGKKQKS